MHAAIHPLLAPSGASTTALSGVDLYELLQRREVGKPRSDSPIFGPRSHAALADLSNALMRNTSFAAFADRLEADYEAADDWTAAGRVASEAGVADAVGRTTAFLIAARNTSGSSESLWGLALSLATARVFAVDLNGLMNAVPGPVADAANQLAERHAEPLTQFVEAQHALTRGLFSDYSSVILFRGERREQSGKLTRGVQPVELRPLSSWTIYKETALGMTNAMDASTRGDSILVMAAAVPVDRVLSTWVTGFGSPFEHEVVLLGGRKGDSCELFS